MESGSKEATELFPRLLQIIEKYDNTQSIFEEKACFLRFYCILFISLSKLILKYH
jgi:hypothetical protein